LGNVCIELFQVAAGNATKRGGEQAVGFRHLAIEVSNIEEAAKRLEGDGIKTEGVKDCGSICPGLKICFFHDPDGNRIELLQGWTDETLK